MRDILKSDLKTTQSLKKSGVIVKNTMSKFDALYSISIHEFSVVQVRNVKLKRKG